MKQETKNLAILVIIALTIRFLLIHTGTLINDMNSWVGWSDKLISSGFENFYSSWSDYLPSFLYILWVLGEIKIALAGMGIILSNDILFKTPAILADIGAAYIIYLLACKYASKKLAIFAFALYAFNPAIFANSAMWGQVDGVEAFLVLLVFWLFLEGRIYLGSILLAFTTLFKPTGIFIAPIIFIYLMLASNKEFQNNSLQAGNGGFDYSLANFQKFLKLKSENIKKIFVSILIFLFTTTALVIPFAGGQAPFGFIFDRYEITINQYQYTSLNAFNFWALDGKMWQGDLVLWNGIPLVRWGMIIFAMISVVSLYFLYKRWSKNEKENFFNAVLVLAIVFMASFLFLTRAHERHMLMALPFLAILAGLNRKFLLPYVLVSVIYLMDLYYAFIWVTENFKLVFSGEQIIILSGVNILVIFYLFYQLVYGCREKES